MLMYIVFAVIVLNPGITIGEVAKKLGVRYSIVEGKLMKMEKVGLFVSSMAINGDNSDEDACEGLFPYSRNGRPADWLVQATN